MPTYTTTEDGSGDGISTWTAGVPPGTITLTNGDWAGIGFVPYTNLDTQGRIIAAPRFVTISIRILVAAASDNGVLLYHYVPEPNPAVYASGAGNTAGTRGELFPDGNLRTTIGRLDYIATGSVTNETTVLTVDSTNFVTVPATTDSMPVGFQQATNRPNDFDTLITHTGAGNWNGRISISAQWISTGSLIFGSGFSVIITTEIPFKTGREAPSDDPRDWERSRECPICGQLTTEDQMVLDGYRRGLLVCPECWDPPDTRPRHIRGIFFGNTN